MSDLVASDDRPYEPQAPSWVLVARAAADWELVSATSVPRATPHPHPDSGRAIRWFARPTQDPSWRRAARAVEVAYHAGLDIDDIAEALRAGSPSLSIADAHDVALSIIVKASSADRPV